MTIQRHIHVYERSKWNKNVYRCADPSCTHFTRKEFIEGKQARCKFCGEIYVMEAYDLRLKNPRCSGCSNRTKHKERAETKELLENILDGAEE